MITIIEYRKKVEDYKSLIIENKKKHYSKNYKGFLKMAHNTQIDDYCCNGNDFRSIVLS